jgi:hypothetical protein
MRLWSSGPTLLLGSRRFLQVVAVPFRVPTKEL